MKRLLIAVLIVFLMASHAMAETIKVLILDGGFKDIPDKDERLGMLNRVKGELLIGYTKYRGDIEVWEGKEGIYLISEIPLEEYIEGVVASEIADNWDMEAVRAQAVVARTYALYWKLQNKGKRFHVTSTVLHQSFKGNNIDLKVSYATKSTEGQILTFGGRKPIEAFYHSTCGGETEDVQEVFGKNYPYIRPVRSECNLSPYLTWTRDIPLKEIEKAVGVDDIKDIKIKSRTSTGRVKELVITGSIVKTIEATELRKKLGWKRLPSTSFTLRNWQGSAVFDGRGYGHGVGLCQWGSLEMAKKGKTYKEILSYYFPNTAVETYEPKGF